MFEKVKDQAVLEFLIISSYPDTKGAREGVAIETGEGIIFSGYSSIASASNAAEVALQILDKNCPMESPDDLTRKFEIAAIAIAVQKDAEPSRKTLDTLGTYIGTQAGQTVIVVEVDRAEQIANIRQIKL